MAYDLVAMSDTKITLTKVPELDRLNPKRI